MNIKRMMIVTTLTFSFLVGCTAGATTTPTSLGKSAGKQPETAASAANSNTDIQTFGPFFTRKDHPDKELIQRINEENNSLDIAIYSLTHTGIVNAVIDAKKRGIKVRVVTDRDQASSSEQSTLLRQLEAAGIPVKANHHKGLMHDKFTVFHHEMVATGSFNYTFSASNTNDENLLFIKNKTIADSYTAQFEAMFNDTANFTDWK